MCESTPFTWDGVNYTSPTRCGEVSEPLVRPFVPRADSYNSTVARRLQCGMCPLKVVDKARVLDPYNTNGACPSLA